MNRTGILELPAELLEVFRRQAVATGRNAEELATEWMSRNGPKPRRRADNPTRIAALEQLRRHAGAVAGGDPRSADNAAIDDTLAADMAGTAVGSEGPA